MHDKGLSRKRRIPVGTTAGRILLSLEADGQVTVDMGVPMLEPASIPFRAGARALTYPLLLPQETLMISAVSMGNPHAVVLVESVATAPVARLGPLIERHGDFPQRVNAGFMQCLDRQHIKLRVYERGAGETLACGTGACAAVVAGRLRRPARGTGGGRSAGRQTCDRVARGGYSGLDERPGRGRIRRYN